MKNKILSKLIAAVVFLFAVVALPSKAKAQGTTCGTYVIKNNLTCAVQVQYIRTCNGNPCGMATTGIGPSNSINVPPCPCAGICDVKVTLLSIGAFPLTPPVSVSSTNPTNSFTNLCTGGPGSLIWGPTVTSIN